jgi:aspartokinase/homoserine dehydrogenase 1
MIKSIKFGGTSMGSAESIIKCISIIESKLTQHDNIVVTVSAVGGVTNKLLSIAQKETNIRNVEHTINSLSNLHNQILCSLVNDQKRAQDIWSKSFLPIFDKLEFDCFNNSEMTEKLTAHICSFGERLSSLLMFYALLERKIKCSTIGSDQIIKTDNNYLDANVNFTTTTKLINDKIQPLFNNNTIPIVTGFMGQNTVGEITLLGRGASDYTAAIMAYAIKADTLEIWTDVNGVMSTDPNICTKAYSLKQLNSGLMLEMSCNGAKVLDHKSIALAIKRDIPIYIYNTFNTTFRGSHISNYNQVNFSGSNSPKSGSVTNETPYSSAVNSVIDQTIVGITSSTKKVIINLALPESINKVNSVLAANNISPRFCTFSESGYNFILENIQLSDKIKIELEAVSSAVSYEDEIVQVCVIGNKIGHNTTIIGSIFNIISNLKVHLYLTHITPINISIFINHHNKKILIEQLHNFLEKNNAIS